MSIMAKKEMMISEKENVFSNLLLTFQNNAGKIRLPTYTLLGDKGCGKEALVDALCSSISTIEPSDSILSYRSVDLSDDMFQGATMNVWILHDYAYEKVFDTISESYGTEKIGFLIALDLSRGEDCLRSLKVWLERVHSIRSRIPSAQNTPTIVIGCKSDSIITTDALFVRKAKDLQGEMRAICILSKATLIYTSATKGTNVEKLRKIMVNQMCASDSFSISSSNEDKEIEDGIDNCIVTQGLDSVELIRISTGFTCEMNSQKMLLNEDASNTAIDSSGADTVTLAAAGNHIGIEDEDEWLAGLQTFIKQVSSTSTSNNTNNNSNNGSSTTILSSLPSLPTATVAVSISTPTILGSNCAGDLDTNMTSTKATISKRLTRKNATAVLEEKQDASDFFKSLLKK